ncbi:MAG: DUF5615 family PIN-like protein [Phycisphaeraceae bacterium]|nr:DUF5615 family PIN-like protein [Phycisphaeraceae bacterium]
MRFLVDESVSWRVARDLREAGHDCVHVDQSGLDRSSDRAIFDSAIGDARHIITQDIDFQTLLLSSGRATPSVLLLRLNSGRARAQFEAIQHVLPNIEADLIAGALIVLFDDRVRVHKTRKD